MHTANEQAAALSFELHMHLEDLLDDVEPFSGHAVNLVSEDTDETVGSVTELASDHNDFSFLVKTADGTVLRVSVEVAE